MKKLLIVLVILVPVLTLAGLGLYYAQYHQPYVEAETVMDLTAPELFEDAGGNLTLTWTAADYADDYIVELRSGKNLLWYDVVAGTSCQIPRMVLPDNTFLRITSRRAYYTPRGEAFRVCDEPLVASFPTVYPTFTNLHATVDPDADTLLVTWDGVEGCTYSVLDAYGNVIASSDRPQVLITFGTDTPRIRKDDTAEFTLVANPPKTDVGFTSEVSASVSVSGDELLGTVLFLELTDLGNNYYNATWNETRGDTYELQELDETGNWKTMVSFAHGETLSYTFGPLKSYTQHVIRVVARGDHNLPGSEFSAQPDRISFETGATTIYATIWPLFDLDIYADTDRAQVVGKASHTKSYCAVEERDGMFLVYFDGGRGYIDSSFCMINLPDYLGDLVNYDIKNSYDAVYMVHDYGIPSTTGTVIDGYEEVASDFTHTTQRRTVRRFGSESSWETHIEAWPATDPGGIFTPDFPYMRVSVTVERPRSFLVPLLYPTAQKVRAAAEKARDMGFRLKIYDSFRPYVATRLLYDRVEALQRVSVPELTYAYMAGDLWNDYAAPYQAPPELEGDSPAPPGPITPSGAEPQPVTRPTGVTRPTYYTLITNNGQYGLSSFLAKNGSRHNQGIAVDLTLEDWDTGEELAMQTSMHDLSWYSVLNYNNANADLLADIMTGSGLGPLFSEWWHFQDDDFLAAQGSLPYRQEGVTRACWIADTTGWRYRTSDGTYLRDGAYTVDGYIYTFDENGYSDYNAWELPLNVLDGQTD